jgi:hypothetical protein
VLLPNSYVLDREAIKLTAYRLICMFYANKEISRLSDPMHEFPEPSALLERAFFGRELTHLLLNLAISVRTLDDQMNALPPTDPLVASYVAARERVNKRYRCMLFDEMTLRETCNKIIHATTVEPHTADGIESHKYDEYMWEAWQDDQQDDHDSNASKVAPMPWEHLSGHVRLGGKQRNAQWWHLLEVPVLVEAVYSLLSNEDQPAVAGDA